VYVRIEDVSDGLIKAMLQQDSGVQASMMAVNNENGEVIAMVGGRDFALSQFNRATQSQRQVGSSFKPYVYTTAIENGAKITDIVVDGPVSFYTPNGPYTPHNYEPDWKGPMRLPSASASSARCRRFFLSPSARPTSRWPSRWAPTASSPTTASASSRTTSGRSRSPTACRSKRTIPR
jgi:hypothetical protein